MSDNRKNKNRVAIVIDKVTEIRYKNGTPFFVNLLSRAEGEIKEGNTVYMNTNNTLLGVLRNWFPKLKVIK